MAENESGQAVAGAEGRAEAEEPQGTSADVDQHPGDPSSPKPHVECGAQGAGEAKVEDTPELETILRGGEAPETTTEADVRGEQDHMEVGDDETKADVDEKVKEEEVITEVDEKMGQDEVKMAEVDEKVKEEEMKAGVDETVGQDQVKMAEVYEKVKEEEMKAEVDETVGQDEEKAKGTEEENAEEAPGKPNAPEAEAHNPNKKRKVAVFLAYVGRGYSGMQHNPGMKTIEGELLHAIHRAGGISDQNVDFEKIHWKRAARTDKGVSAIGNVVSAKLILEPEGLVERINAELPEQIRILGMKRTTAGFDARLLCDRRQYEYIMPCWAFDPNVCRGRKYFFNKTKQAEEDTKQSEPEAKGEGTGQADGTTASADVPAAGQEIPEPGVETGAAGDGAPSETAGHEGKATEDPPSAQSKVGTVKELLPADSKFVFGPEEKARLDALLKQFAGTHNFHNFTVQVSPTEARSNRHIWSFNSELFDLNGVPYVRMVVTGNSFMLHQIRKMVIYPSKS